MRGDEQDTIDERIDDALRRYAEAPQFSEPRVALARVRALAEQEPERRWSVWAWAAPLGAALLIAVAAIVWMGTGGPKKAHPVQVAKSAPQGLKSPASVAPNGTTEVVPFQNTTRLPSRSDREMASVNHCCGPRRGTAIRAVAGDSVVADRSVPKQEVFPTPQPLSQEEQALVAFVAQASPDVTRQVIEAQKHLGDPIQIAAITIRPLDEEEQNAEPKGKEN